MATFTKRGDSWFVRIRRKGHSSISRSFNTRSEAERWALTIESGMGVGTYVDNRETLTTTLHECLERYAREVMPLKKGAAREAYRVKMWQADKLAVKAIGAIKQTDMARWRDSKLASGLSGTSVKLDLSLLSHVFTIAIKEWGFPLTNPVAMIRKPKSGMARNRRFESGEEERLLKSCSPELKAFVILALQTGMRRGELCSLRRSWIKGRVAYLPDTKNGMPRAVPLSTRALETIASLPLRIDGVLFGLLPDAYTKGFMRACRKAEIVDFHLHDLRHEATSRFFEKGLDVMQVKEITGHKSLQMLSRYTHLKTDDLAQLLC
ncbi:MAG: site-specific integrase [Candidatus Moranbacteria bacterium]|nr:site-specific integrase [Candidatus Moranbacteria bacterium]